MVNTGKPSTGCHACRKRKVKCDEGVPGCRRCAAIGVDCPGYRQQIDVFFRDKNVLTKETVRKRSSPGNRKSLVPKVTGPHLAGGETTLVVREMPGVASFPHVIHDRGRRERSDEGVADLEPVFEVPRSPKIEPAVYAVARFYSDYVMSKDVIPYLTFLPELFSKPRMDYCLAQALPAVALASASRQGRASELMLEANKHYSRGCTALASAITDPARQKTDEVFVAVFLLGLYELITGARVTTGIWDAHSSGREALMHLRGRNQLKTKMGRNLYMLMHKQMLINCFVGREMPKDNFEKWFPPPSAENKSNVVMHWEYTMHRISRWHASAAQGLESMKRTGDYNQDKLYAYMRDGMDFDYMLTSRVRQMPRPGQQQLPDQHYARHWAKHILDPEDLSSEAIYEECRKEDQGFFCQMTPVLSGSKYRSVRLHLLQVLFELVDAMDKTEGFDYLSLQEHWRSESAKMVQEICASVPQFLGPLGSDGMPKARQDFGSSLRGYMLLWPLRVSITSIGVSNSQRQWIKSILEYIGEELGIGQAKGIAQLMPTLQPYRGPCARDDSPEQVVPGARPGFAVFGTSEIVAAQMQTNSNPAGNLHDPARPQPAMAIR